MSSIKKFFRKTPNKPVQEHTTTKDKIHAFNSIVLILAQIQQGPPFQDNEMPNKNPPNQGEQLQMRLLNTFAHLAVANTDVVGATLYTLHELTIMAWIQDQNSSDQDKPEAAQDTHTEPKSKPKLTVLWDKVCWLFACNMTNDAMRPGSNYQGPCIIQVMPPAGYPNRSDSKENLLQYLNDFPKKWWVQSISLVTMYD